MRLHRAFRSGLSLIALVAIALVGFFASPGVTFAQPGGGNQDCPAGTVQLTKFNFIAGQYILEGANSGGVVITNADADGGSWTSSLLVSNIVVKGSNESFVQLVQPPATSGSFDNSGLTPNGQGNLPDISNIKFCGPEDQPPPVDCCILVTDIDLMDTGSNLVAKVAVQYSDGYIGDNIDVTVSWDLPGGGQIVQTVNTQADGGVDNIATFSIPQGVDGSYKVTVIAASDPLGAELCGPASETIEISAGCCLEAYVIDLDISGNDLVAKVYTRFTDGYIPDNVDVTVTWATPDGQVTQTVNTTADGVVDNIATFALPLASPGIYQVVVTDADGFDGTPFCRGNAMIASID